MTMETSTKRVVYLIGAGASHACVSSVGSPYGILMRHLGEPLRAKLRELINNGFAGDASLEYLVNSVIDDTTDFEHIITFLDDAPSLRHRQFAEEMRNAFEEVLRDRLNRIREETQGDAVRLYKVLIDMHSIDHFQEVLQGIITINYDEYLEDAIEQVGQRPVDFGVRIEPWQDHTEGIRLLKLHGSFGWQNTWPITRGQTGDATLWIPPGITKAKQAYPFNVLWGLAREMLSCDILRVIGCRLGANDWDLISLLFTMQHVNLADRPQIEVIDAPLHVKRVKDEYPYLEVRSILEGEPIGSQLVSELTTHEPQAFLDLTEDQQQEIIDAAGLDHNWFELWLRAKVESLLIDLGNVSTSTGVVESYLTA